MSIMQKIAAFYRRTSWFVFSELRGACSCPPSLIVSGTLLASEGAQTGAFLRILNSLVMNRDVDVLRHYNKIFNAVVIPDAINVVNYLALMQGATEMGCHYQNMFTNISTMVGIWMIRAKNENIVVAFILVATALPIMMLRSRFNHSTSVVLYPALVCNG